MEMKELEPRENEGHNVQGIRSNRWTRASPLAFETRCRTQNKLGRYVQSIRHIHYDLVLPSCRANQTYKLRSPR
jgi:hypothetical protein